MVEDDSTFRKIDDLYKELELIFLGLKGHLAKIEMHFRSVELDYMYKNVEENVYLEKMQKINKKIFYLNDVLEGLKKMEKSLQQEDE